MGVASICGSRPGGSMHWTTESARFFPGARAMAKTSPDKDGLRRKRKEDKAILQRMLRYLPAPTIDSPKRLENLDGWDISREAGDLLLNDSNAFLFSCLFNYQ